MKVSLELVERFHEKWVLDVESGCWLWTASTAGNGYGQIKIPGERRQIYAHRLSYLIHYGELSDSVLVCHVCDNPSCVRPSHLFVGSPKDNLTDMKEKGRHLFGVKNAKAKLTDDLVRHVFKLSSLGLSQGKIAKTFGVAQGTIFKILHGQRWEHIFREFHPGGE